MARLEGCTAGGCGAHADDVLDVQALESAGHPDINIICEKVAFDGVTRFEDRFRLPLAVTVNFTSHTAKMLLEVRGFTCCWKQVAILSQGCHPQRLHHDFQSCASEPLVVEEARRGPPFTGTYCKLLSSRAIMKQSAAIMTSISADPLVLHVPETLTAAQSCFVLLAQQLS